MHKYSLHVFYYTQVLHVCVHTHKCICTLSLERCKAEGTTWDRKVKQDTRSQKCFITNPASLVRPRPNLSMPGLRSTWATYHSCSWGARQPWSPASASACSSCDSGAGAHGRKQLSTADTAPPLLPSQTTPALLSSMSLLLGQNLFQHIQTVGLTGLLK